MGVLPYEELPQSLQTGMELYIERGVPPGSFLRSFLENDLYGAIGHADAANCLLFRGIYHWLLEHAPSQSWGSRILVTNWIGVKRCAEKS